MAIKGTCLLNNTELKEALFDVVRVTAYDRLKTGKPATVSAIYSDIRKVGIEVDFPTIGEIYNSVLPRDDANFDSEQQIDDAVGRTFRQTIQRVVELETPVGERQIDEQSPETEVANFIVKAFGASLASEIDERTRSEMKVLQDALMNGVKRKLGKLSNKATDKKTMIELINESLSLEQSGIRDLNGRLNSISDLYDAMRVELSKASREIRDGAEPETIERYNEYVKHLENATYTLLFKKADAIQVRNQAMIDAGFGKKLSNGNIVLDWNKMAGQSGSIPLIRQNVERAFVAAGYSTTVIERLKDTLQDEFEDLRASIIERQLNNPEGFGRMGQRSLMEDAGFNSLLNGKTPAQWIKDENIENVEDLSNKVNEALKNSTYLPSVKRIIARRFENFFRENFAKVSEAEAQRAIDELLGDLTALEWIKQNGIQNQDELYTALDAALAERNINQVNTLLIRGEFNRILDIDNRGQRELRGREGRMGREYSPKKSDLKRLVELYHLGVFTKGHDKLLYQTLGVSDLQAQDIEDIQSLAKYASDLSRKIADPKGFNLGNDVFANREFQYIQRHIDTIIQRNINNKSRLLKILSWFSNFSNVMLSGLLGLPSTISQNIISGAKSVFTAMRFQKGVKEEVIEKDGKFYVQSVIDGKEELSDPFDTKEKADAYAVGFWGRTKQAAEIYKAMMADVARTGQAYGEEIGSFATQELFLNSLRFKWSGGSVSDKAKTALFVASYPMRLGLLAFDSANKVALTNKVFFNIIYNSLVSQKDISPDLAMSYMNESLFGQSFENAKKLAKDIIDMRNAALPDKFKDKVTDAYITTLANDIVKFNLQNGGQVSKEVLEAAVKGSYHVAGLGLGHEPNNYFSRAIKTYRDRWRQEDRQIAASKDWHKLAMHKMFTTFMNNYVIQFAGGATNWMWLRAKEGLGLGLLRFGRGNWNKDIDFANIKDLQDEIIKREGDRNDIARSFIGAAYTMAWYAFGFPLFGSGGDEDDNEKLKSLESKKNKTEKDREQIEELKTRSNVYASIKSQRTKDKFFRALSPDIQLINYYAANSQSRTHAEGALNYAVRTYIGPDQFTLAGRLKQSAQYFAKGDNNAALGSLGAIVGDRLSVPLYRPLKEYVRIGSNWFKPDSQDVEPPAYKPPTNFWEGIAGGGLLQDLGVVGGGKASITMLPGIGPASYEKFKKKGMTRMSDLKDGFWNAKDGNSYILDADDRFKAKKAYEKWKKEN